MKSGTITTTSSHDIATVRRKIDRENSKTRLALEMARVINLACEDEQLKQHKQLWQILHRVL